MSGTILQLRGSTVYAITTRPDDQVRVRFAPALIVKSEGIPGVDASTLWTQSGELVIDEGEIEGALPGFPAMVTGGSVEAGGLKYMDMTPVPLTSVGYAQLRLTFESGADVVVTGSGATLELEDIPKYVKHIAETQPQG